jgi:hypothetical protein
VHCYWILRSPVTPAEWRQIQDRLIDHCNGDPQCKNPSRVMRLPGSAYLDKKTGRHIGTQATIIRQSGHRYQLAEILAALPEPTPAAHPPARSIRQSDRSIRQSDRSRSLEEIQAAANCIPVRVGGENTYESDRNALCGCAAALAEIGLPEAMALELLGNKWPSREEAAQVLNSAHTRNAASFWAIASQHGYKLSRSRPTANNGKVIPLHRSPAPADVEVQQQEPLPLTESQRFELLRGRARQVLQEHPRKVEQELAMRMAAQDLDLPSLGPTQVRALLWEARNGDAGPVQPLTPDQPLSLAPTPWLLVGIIMAGALNLIVALPKVGKTAWVLGFLGAWIHGQQTFLGCDLPATPCPPVLIIGTDQPENDWGRMLAQFGLLDHNRRMNARIIGLFTAGRPLHLDAEGIDRITGYAEQHPGLLVLIDSLHACISPLGLKEESAEVAEPVRDLMCALDPHGATVLLIHHASKGRANDGAVAASRGSTALPAVASQTISLTRLQTGSGGQPGSKERRLVIKTEGRGGMPQELLIERTDAEGWICHGDAATALEEQAREQARERLTDRQQSVMRLLIDRATAGEITTVSDVVTALDLSRQRAQETLGALVQKRLAIKTVPTESTPDGGRPAATYKPVPDACRPT